MTTTMRDTTEILARQHRFAARAPENAKTPPLRGGVFVCGKEEPDDYLLSHGQSALSSAWSRFTVLF
ncbi:hypothetical protein, partial [Caballeronia sp. GAWG1-5s-s]|uniref:hypothetical protein n=1 Tax=Caballeronia sp. GAWG1-5s-s TaxID=2921743 RepID=UPI002028E716